MNVAEKKKKIMLFWLGLVPECFVVSIIEQFLNIRRPIQYLASQLDIRDSSLVPIIL
jgi:hypothetical protein